MDSTATIPSDLPSQGNGRWAGSLPWLVLVVGVVAAIAIAAMWNQRNQEDTGARLHEALSRSAVSVEHELRRYEDLLRAINSAFEGGRVSGPALERYLRSAQIDQRYPAAEAVALVAPGRGGRPVVRAAAPRGVAAKAFAEIGRSRAALDALRRSRASGAATLSAERLTPTLFLPFYSGPTRSDAQRGRDLRAWLAVRFRSAGFMAAPLRTNRDVGMELFIRGAGARPVGVSTREKHDGPVEQQLVRTHGQQMRLTARALSGFKGAGKEPLLVLSFGVALSLLLAALVQSLSRAEARAHGLASSTVDALLELEQRFRHLAATPVGIFRADASGHITYANERFSEIVGQHFPDARGLQWCELADGIDAGGVLAAWRKAVDSQTEVDVEFRFDDGNCNRWFSCRLAPLLGEGWVGFVEEVSERKREQAELERRASRDPLTELPNRKHFLDRLSSALRRSERRGDRLAVMFLDLDGFKEINDVSGHQAGDLVLVAISERLNHAMRPRDMVARFGGDEFAVLCERLKDAGEAAALARRIDTALHEPVTVEGDAVRVPVSVGIAVGPGPGVTPEALVRAADEAMYRAKRSGRTFELVDVSPLDLTPPPRETPAVYAPRESSGRPMVSPTADERRP